MLTHYDLIIVGSGPAGRSAAMQAGKLKRRVLVVDSNHRVGGVSCLLYTSDAADE